MISIPFRETLVDDVTDLISELTSSQVEITPKAGCTPSARVGNAPGQMAFLALHQGYLQPNCNPALRTVAALGGRWWTPCWSPPPAVVTQTSVHTSRAGRAS